MEAFLTADGLVTLLTLTLLEVVLGIDNVVFLAILVGKLPRERQARARRIGLGLALGARIVLLLGLTWLMKLTTPLFHVFSLAVSGKDLILLAGGLFLIGKATYEIHERLEGGSDEHLPGETSRGVPVSEGFIIVQIVLIDLVFSLDSVITAVGMANQIAIMIAAVVIAIAVMLAFAGAVGDFVNRHPSIKILALSFLILIGVMLVAEATHQHIPRGYVYFAMAFSLGVEMLNMRASRGRKPVHLKGPDFEEEVVAPTA